MSIKIKSSDVIFNDSPEAGTSACICSRCAKRIPEKDAPILRVKTKEFFTADNRELRYCRKCSEEMGFVFPLDGDYL